MRSVDWTLPSRHVLRSSHRICTRRPTIHAPPLPSSLTGRLHLPAPAGTASDVGDSPPPVELLPVCARALNKLLCEAAEPSRTVSTAPLDFATVGVCFTDEEFASSATPATSAAALAREAAAHRELLLAPVTVAQSGQVQSPSGMAYKRRIDITLSQWSSYPRRQGTYQRTDSV